MIHVRHLVSREKKNTTEAPRTPSQHQEEVATVCGVGRPLSPENSHRLAMADVETRSRVRILKSSNLCLSLKHAASYRLDPVNSYAAQSHKTAITSYAETMDRFVAPWHELWLD
jgi:hypothetical protein